MKKSSNNNPIVTIDIYNNNYLKFTNEKVEKVVKLKYDKKTTYISYIANSNLIIEAIDLSPSLPPETLTDVVTDKVYEELKLDLATEYSIVPIRTAISKDNKIRYQAFIVNLTEVKNKFSPLRKKIKSIDYIIPAPLLYEIFYTNKQLNPDGCEAFLYFGEKESFITFYYEGKYLYSKSIKHSLDYIYDRVIQLAQEAFISKKDFIKILSISGFRVDNEKLARLLIQVFNECFLNINDVVIYTKRVYGINKIKTLYIGFNFGYLDGISSYVKNYLNLQAVPINSIYSNSDPKTSIDPLHSLMFMNALALNKKKIELPNFTPFPKPPPFFKRPAGKLIQGFILIILLFMIPAIYDYTIGLSKSYENKVLKIKEEKLNKTVTHYKKVINSKKEELKSLEKAINKLKKIYSNKKGELENVYNKKFNYTLKSEQLALITKIINKFDIKSRKIVLENNIYYIELESKDEKEITAFIKKLIETFKNQISFIDIKDIKLDKKEHIYKGVLKVEFIKD